MSNNWQNMADAPHDRLIVIHCANAHSLPVKIGKYIDGQWIHTVTGIIIHAPTGWCPVPDYSQQPKATIDTKRFKNHIFCDRNLEIFHRRKAGETNQDVAKAYKISTGRTSQIYQRINKKMFDL